jgi:peptide/nickel transport system substrate-binding protein
MFPEYVEEPMRKTLMMSVLLVMFCVLVACTNTPQQPLASPAQSATLPVVAATSTVPQPTTVPTTAAGGPTPLPKTVRSTLTIKLRPGVKWSDGTDLTAQDFVGGYDLLWAQGDTSWAALDDVVARDTTTIEFQLSSISPELLRSLLRSYQTAPRSQYGPFMDRARELRMNNADQQGEAVRQLLADLEAFQPDTAVSYGPFAIDPASITEAQMELVKHPSGFNAGKIAFEKVIVYYGQVTESTPLVLSGQLDYSTHAYTPADIAAFEQMPNIEIIRGPTGTGPAIWFNESVEPLNKKELRQAIAYVVDRAETATVALGDSGKPVKYMAGFSDLLVSQWLSPDTIGKLNLYRQDRQKAAALLIGLGFTQGADGRWADDRGAPLAFELAVPSDFADWLGAAENVAQQLTAFGIQTTVRGYPSAERAAVLREARYQLLIDFGMLTTPPHPAVAYHFYMTDAFFNANNPEAIEGSKGLNWSWRQQAPDGTQIDVRDYIVRSTEGIDIEAQKRSIEPLALIYNDQLPVISLFERYANDPIDTQTRVTGWLPLDDPIYQNNQGGDNYVAIQFLNGTLKVAPGGDGTFRTSYPYPQPPNYSFNYFAANSLQQNVGYPATHFLFPPLFWYMQAQGEYVPAVAESYQLRGVR